MRYSPENVQVYFMKSDPSLSRLVVMEGDTIWVKTSETIIPEYDFISSQYYENHIHHMGYPL